MTIVSTSTSSGPYAATADTTFAVTSYTVSEDEIEITLDGAIVSPTLYTFTRDTDGTGEVVFASAVTGEVIIYSKPAFDQPDEFQRFGAFFPDMINDKLDKAAARDLYLRDAVLPAGSTRASRAGFYLGWDAAGNPDLISGQGNPGGNIMSVGLFTDISSLSGDDLENTDIIQTSGRTAPGDYPARYVRDSDQTTLTVAGTALAAAAADPGAAATALTALLGRVRQQDANGDWWIAAAWELADAGTWGYVADGVDTAGTFTGTDNAAAVNAMIDYFTYINTYAQTICRIPEGTGRFASPIHMGRGNITSVTLQGAGLITGGAGYGGGTLLLMDYTDHPGITANTLRKSFIENMTIRGKSYQYVAAAQLGTLGTMTTPDDRLLASWFDPTMPLASTAKRYAPYAGVAVDPYHGAIPDATDRYPDLTLPAWLPAAAKITYGRTGGTSHLMIRNVRIEGFTVGIVVHPGNHDGNGDFVETEGAQIAYCAIARSNGNSQARANNNFGSTFGPCHTLFATSLHGQQNGNMAGLTSGGTVDGVMNWFTFNNGAETRGVVVFEGLRGENCFELGRFVATQTGAKNIVMRECDIDWNLQDATAGARGIPKTVLANSSSDGLGTPSGKGMLVMEDCSMGLFPTVFTAFQNIHLDRTVLASNYALGAFADGLGWKKCAHDTLAGGLVVPKLDPAGRAHRIAFDNAPLTGGGSILKVLAEPLSDWTTRDNPGSHYSQSFSPKLGRTKEAIPNYQKNHGTDKAVLTSNTFTTATGVWSFTVGYDAPTANLYGFCPGGVFVDEDGFVFWVSARGGVSGAWTITAQLQNGYAVDTGGATRSYPWGSFTHNSGTVYSIGGRFFTPSRPLYFTTNTSTGLTAVQSSDGTVNDSVAVNDWVFIDDYRDAWAGAGVQVNNVTAVPSTTQLTVASAATGSTPGHRLELAQRAQP